MRILIVEDKNHVAEAVENEIVAILDDAQVKIAGLTDAEDELQQFGPDAVVLDWYEGEFVPENAKGQPLWKEIWESRFCPVIVYTGGEPDSDPAFPDNHPFIRVIKKGSGSDAEVAELLKSFLPHIQAMQGQCP